jgi:hypothetical protein
MKNGYDAASGAALQGCVPARRPKGLRHNWMVMLIVCAASAIVFTQSGGGLDPAWNC